MGLGWKVLSLRTYLPAIVAKVLCPNWRDRALVTSGQVKDEFELSPPVENTPPMAGVAFSGADDWCEKVRGGGVARISDGSPTSPVGAM